MAGLFGAPRRLPQIDPSAMGIDRPQPYSDVRIPQAAPQAPRKPGFADKLGQIGDILISYGQGRPTLRQEMAARQQVEEQAMRARQLLAQQQRQWGREDKQWEWQNKPQDPASLQYFDDNAGNRYSYNPATGQQQLIFTDPNDKMFVQDDQLITVPNRVRSQQQVRPGHIEDGYRFKGGNPADRSAWEPVAMGNEQGGALLGAAARSNTITPDEAARIRQSLGPGGQSAFEAWLRNNNISVGGR